MCKRTALLEGRFYSWGREKPKKILLLGVMCKYITLFDKKAKNVLTKDSRSDIVYLGNR